MSAATDTTQKALTVKQQRFARHFARHGNGTRAAREAGYSEVSAHSIAHENIRKPEIAQAIELERRQILSERGITPNGVLSMIADIAKFDISEIFNEDGSVKEVSEMSDVAKRVVAGIETFTITAKDGTSFTTTSKIRLPDRIRALEILAKHFSLLSENVTLKGDVESPFIAIIRAAQGTSLKPATQRIEHDDANTIDGEIISQSETPVSDAPAPAQPTVASGNSPEVFRDIGDADGEDEREAVADTYRSIDDERSESEQQVVDEAVAAAEAQQEDVALARRPDIAPLWKRRRCRNV